MELELNRIDYYSVGATLPNCMKLMPSPSYKDPQRVAVGDQDGIIHVFSMKKGELVIHFKTLPAEKIQCVQLGGSLGSVADKIFIACDNKVKAFNKKGKMFLTFTSSLTEPIKSMFVSGNDMILCGNHVYNHYRDCKDIGSYLCGDTIVDAIAICPNNSSRIITVLACSGRVIRILEHCRVRQSIELESVPTVLHIPRGYNDRIICGMADGRVVVFKVGNLASTFTEEIIIDENDSAGAVTTIDVFDLTGDSKLDLIVGRRDGTVQVFSLPNDDNTFDSSVRQIYCENFNESISSVQGGCIDSSGHSEIVISTYTGRVFGLTSRVLKKSLSDAHLSSFSNFPSESSSRIEKLREEIRELETKVQKERERYKISTQNLSGGFSAIPMLPINASLNLSQDDATYSLTVELPAPIEFVLLQSNAPLQLIDVEKSSAVVSFSTCDPSAGNHLLATYRCQVDVNRLDLRFRTIEGQYGTLQTFITPNIQPKVSQLQEYQIRPLSLHMRIHHFDQERPHNQLIIKGSFSMAELHSWISNCVPEVPGKYQADDHGKCVLYFRNVFVCSQLMCEYGKGEVTFKSENVSTISIVKEFITKEATKRRCKLEINLSVCNASVLYMIELISPMLKKYGTIHDEYQMIHNLIDLDVQDANEVKALGSEYADLVERKAKIIDDYEGTSHMFDRIITLINSIYSDFNRLNGNDVRNDFKQLKEFIVKYDNDSLANFILGRTDEDE